MLLQLLLSFFHESFYLGLWIQSIFRLPVQCSRASPPNLERTSALPKSVKSTCLRAWYIFLTQKLTNNTKQSKFLDQHGLESIKAFLLNYLSPERDHTPSLNSSMSHITSNTPLIFSWQFHPVTITLLKRFKRQIPAYTPITIIWRDSLFIKADKSNLRKQTPI